jgi:hypothetical protein
VVVIAGNANVALRANQIEAFARVRTIPKHVAQADDSRRAAALDVGEHRSERLEITVDIADNRKHEFGIDLRLGLLGQFGFLGDQDRPAVLKRVSPTAARADHAVLAQLQLGPTFGNGAGQDFEQLCAN